MFLIPKQTRNHRTAELALMQRWVVLVQDGRVFRMEPAMTDFRALLADLRRPQLLIRAARCGLSDYRRERDLRRLLDAQPSPDRAIRRLLTEEDRLETIRQSGEASYSVTRHIEVLIALMSEVRLLPRNVTA